ncbi:MAG: hypothetical protein AAFP70_20345, partial [Calditrichota bacterium]
MHMPLQFNVVQKLLTFVFFLSISAIYAQAPPPVWLTLQPGEYPVAFSSFTIVDSSRSMLPYNVRPLRIFLWYPARDAADKSNNLTFGKYLETSPEPRFSAYFDSLSTRDKSTASRQFRGQNADSLLQVLLKTTVYAQRAGEPHAGKFPLVLHSLGRNNYQLESTVLWEYLASHGYVVATVPQMGTSVADHRLAFTMTDMLLHAEDLLFASRYLQSKFRAEKLGLIGHSSGSIAEALAVDSFQYNALVSLDGSISTTDGNELLNEEAFSADKVTLPVLNL